MYWIYAQFFIPLSTIAFALDFMKLLNANNFNNVTKDTTNENSPNTTYSEMALEALWANFDNM